MANIRDVMSDALHYGFALGCDRKNAFRASGMKAAVLNAWGKTDSKVVILYLP